MATKPTIMSDEDLVTKVSALSKEAVGWFDSKLSRERERVTKYYNGVLPARQHEGASSYVSTDVYDSVEMAKAQVAETFSSGEDIAQLDPDNDMDVEECRKATLYAARTIYRRNDGFNIFTSVIHDGLTARNGVAKAYWEKKEELTDEEFENVPYDQAQAIAAHEDVDSFEADNNGDDTFTGSLSRKYDCSGVRIDNVAPDEFLISPRATAIKTAPYCAHRTPKTRAELLEMGFDRDKVMRCNDEADSASDTPEAQARHEPIEDGQTAEPIGEEMRQMLLYDEYVRVKLDSRKGVRLYKICRVGSVLLSKEEVDKAPFIVYVPLPIPHAFYGNSFAARVIPVQNARTVLVRGILDHTLITNNPRWQVVNGGLLNPREMLENRLGGLVNVRRPDSVTPLPQSALNPFVFNTLSMLKDDKEQSTGISSMAQGMNKDAISTQNSAALMDQVVNLSGQRGKISARHFANNFLVPLMLEVVRLAIVNEAPEEEIEDKDGSALTIDPKQWKERKTCTVSMHLGYGEKDKAAGDLAGVYSMLAADQSLSNMFGLPQKYEMIRDYMKLKGLNRAPAYIASPDKVEPVQPDPFKKRELDIKEMTAKAALDSANAAQTKTAKTIALDTQRLDIANNQLQMEAMDNDRAHNRQDLDTAARISQGEEHLDIERAKVEVARNKPQPAARPQ